MTEWAPADGDLRPWTPRSNAKSLGRAAERRMSKELLTNGTVMKPDWPAAKAEKQAMGEAEDGNNCPSLTGRFERLFLYALINSVARKGLA